MKLKRLKINVPYKSLQAGFEIIFQPNLQSHTIDPLCFVGPNGSGKSNVLEAIADIFYYLECHLFEYTSVSTFQVPIESFEIEYYKPFMAAGGIMEVFNDNPIISGQHYLIKIIKHERQKPNYYLITDLEEIEITGDSRSYALPKRIWGYSSGDNESLSLPFKRMDLFYLEQAAKNIKKNVGEIIGDNRLHFVDYDTTSALVLSNFLMYGNPNITDQNKRNKLKIFKDKFGIESIESFRITIRFQYRNKFKMPIDKAVQNFIHILKKHFGISEERKATDEISINIDLRNVENFEVFERMATDAGSLYKYFEKLMLRNRYTIPWERRQKVLYSDNIYSAQNDIGHVPNDEQLFVLDNIILKMDGVESPVPYESISDGEHQALTIFSLINLIDEIDVLCLFDEPETHLNPKWKYEYISTINDIQKQKDSHILMTTHDPIFISGLSKEQVILFQKRTHIPNDIPRWSFAEEDLKGKGVDAILTSEIFNLSTTLDQNTLNKFIERRKLLLLIDKGQTDDDTIERLKNLNEELNDIDFNKPFDDPLYKEFIKALDNLEDYKRIDLSEQEKRERQKISDSILQKLNRNIPE
ncbi:AAA family ATPase [Zobellia uliginosa]|uniref:AAA family ATPase n=1 Tax=Zobellia uliginosa TaxID=143224 RepID=UPI0026E41F6A|nr:AAA family ATPase [Zobellia uliginosa]MDO6516105.1 AAA family ATPase [Zobellia uliginosa]